MRQRKMILLGVFSAIAAGLIASRPWATSGQQRDEFHLYQLEVYCDIPRNPVVIFSTTGTGLMGTKQICVGVCDGRSTSIKDALKGLSARLATAFNDQVQNYETNAAAGKGSSIAKCIGYEPPPPPEEEKCDTKKACQDLASIGKLIEKYQGRDGFYFGSFVEFNQKLGPSLQQLSEALACRYNQGYNAKDAAILNDFIGQMLKDRNSFKTASGQSAVPQPSSCRNEIGIPIGPACDDFSAIDRIRSNASALAGMLGCEGPAKEAGPVKKDCKELTNGVLDGLTNFFEKVKETKSQTKIGSGDAYDQVSDGIKSALKELEDAAKEIEGTGGTGAQQYKDIQEKIGKLKKLLGIWDQIKAASCLPPEIQQLLRRLATEKRSGTEHDATCTELCGKTADWYVKMTGLTNRAAFFEACSAACF